MRKLSLFELFLIELIIYLVIWFANDYLGTIVTIIFTTITFCILLISFIVEWIEPSKVQRSYYQIMGISILAPLVAAAIYIGIVGGELYWFG